MLKRFFHIALVMFLLLRGGVLFGQTNWDKVLDQYESICAQCLDLRKKVSSGESYSQSSLSDLLTRLGELRRTLSDGASKMSTAQRNRFDSIRSRYLTVEPVSPAPTNSAKPQTPSKSQAPLSPSSPKTPSESLSTPIGEKESIRPSLPLIEPLSVPQISRYPVFQPLDTALDIEAVHPVEAAPKDAVSGKGGREIEAGVIASLALGAPMSYGGKFILRKGRSGAFLSFRSSFSSIKSGYSIHDNGEIEGGGFFWGDGESGLSSLSVSGGYTYHLLPYLFLYGGGGYFSRERFLRDMEGTWAKESDKSFSGFFPEAGCILEWGHILLDMGCSYEGAPILTAGVGVKF